MLDAMRQENRDLAGQVGYLQARVQLHEETIRALQAPESSLDASTASQPATLTSAEPFWSRWRTSAPWLLLAVILLLAVVLLGWPR